MVDCNTITMKKIIFFALLLVAISGQSQEIKSIKGSQSSDASRVYDDVFKGFTYFVDVNDQLNLASDFVLERVEVYNVLGQRMISKNLSNFQDTMNLSELNSGVYIVRLKIAGREKAFKIVKR